MIDAMLDKIGITTDRGRKRHLTERLGPAMQELAEKWQELRGDMPPEAHRGKMH